MNNYSWKGHCRSTRHVRANRQFGGVGILIKNTILNEFDISVISDCFDGIFGILFTNILTDLKFIVLAVYLPPEESPWGRHSDNFFAHLLSLIYMNTHVDHIVICGDLNARIGNSVDFIPDIDKVGHRRCIDNVKNKHGEAFLDFLMESKMIILNGRVTNEHDNYTSVSSRGAAVVDYIFATQNTIDICKKCTVLLVSDVIANYNLSHLLSERCKQPDHSLIVCEMLFDRCGLSDLSTETDPHNHVPQGIKSKKYCFTPMPPNFMSSQTFISNVENVMSHLSVVLDAQSTLDDVYNDFCTIVLNDMDQHLPARKIGKHKKRVKYYKPYWNSQVSTAWKEMREAEKVFLRYRGSRIVRQRYRSNFVHRRKIFDKSLRKAEREYFKSIADEIERINTNDPKAFWNHINRLGPQKSNEVPMKVKLANGTVSCDTGVVHTHWQNEFHRLLNNDPGTPNLSHGNILTELRNIESQMLSNDALLNTGLNQSISQDEVNKAVRKLKNNKAVGPDCIPNEVLKHPNVLVFLHKLCQFCFENKTVPVVWTKAIISPVPKSSNKDPCIPLNYRGISLLCCASKLYSSIINNRLTKQTSVNNKLVEEQNGFRKGRSCQDHVFVLTSIIMYKLDVNEEIFASFIDFKKAFDWINRDFLLYKLAKSFGISGGIYWAIKALLLNSKSCVKLNSTFTNYFNVSSGVRQGDCLSPTLFNFFINDLAIGIKDLQKGVNIGNLQVSILLYADDIVFLSESKIGLQSMLNYLFSWCKEWGIEINESKSNIVHFRKQIVPRTTHTFKFGDKHLNMVNEYRYLGLYLNEFMNLEKTVSHLATAGTRALGALRNKLYNLKNVHFKTYSKLYQSCVTPIIDYCSAVWGFRSFKSVQDVQNRAIRYFLGVHKFCPLPFLEGDMGWTSCNARCQTNMINYWNSIQSMQDTRLPKKILNFEISRGNDVNSWYANFCKITTPVDSQLINVMNFKIDLDSKQNQAWNNIRHQKVKLRYYNLFKFEINPEKYVVCNLTKSQRSLYAQFRSGILPLAIETGRFTNVSLSNRTCLLCNSGEIEDEFHFLCICIKYSLERNKLYRKVERDVVNFDSLDDIDKFLLLNSEYQLETALFVYNAFDIRKNCLYN